MNEVKPKQRKQIWIDTTLLDFTTARMSSSYCVAGSAYDRQCGSDPSHADSEGGAEAHPRVPPPAVSHNTNI